MLLLYVDVKKQLESLLKRRRNVNLDLVLFSNMLHVLLYILFHTRDLGYTSIFRTRDLGYTSIPALNPSELFRFMKS